jgi:uncharacterized protein YndB with AHSA1/START domain
LSRTILTVFLALTATTFSLAAQLPPVVSEGIIDAPPAEVWRAWTTAEGMRSWLAPKADIDLRIDGLMRANYNPKGELGDDSTIENKILAFDPERMFAIRVAKAPQSFPFPNAVQKMWTVVYFSDLGAGKTFVRAIGHGFTDDPESARMRDFFQKGNDYTLAELFKRFKQ